MGARLLLWEWSAVDWTAVMRAQYCEGATGHGGAVESGGVFISIRRKLVGAASLPTCPSGVGVGVENARP